LSNVAGQKELMLGLINTNSVRALMKLQKNTSKLSLKHVCKLVLSELQEEAAVLYNDVKESKEEASMVKFAMSLPYFLTKTNLKQKMYIENGLVDIILAQLSKADLQDSKDAARSLNFFIRASLKKQKKLPSNFVGFPPQTPEFGVALNDEMLSDCVFNVEGKKIYASKAILATRSDYFRKLFVSITFHKRKSVDVSIWPVLSSMKSTNSLPYLVMRHERKFLKGDCCNGHGVRHFLQSDAVFVHQHPQFGKPR
jgi:hypothetical protein